MPHLRGTGVTRLHPVKSPSQHAFLFILYLFLGTLNKRSNSPKSLIIQATDSSDYCPVAALIDYWKVRPPHKGLVFQATNGPSVKRHYLSTNKILLVAMTGHDASRYDTHGLRIGRTTDIARAGVPDHIIKETGPWESHAYKLCIRSFVFPLPR